MLANTRSIFYFCFALAGLQLSIQFQALFRAQVPKKPFTNALFSKAGTTISKLERNKEKYDEGFNRVARIAPEGGRKKLEYFSVGEKVAGRVIALAKLVIVFGVFVMCSV